MKKIELIDKRKEKEKHFLNEDGEFEALLYEEDIHFLKDDCYEEIDNSLIIDDDCCYNANNSFTVQFGLNKNTDLLYMTKDKYFIYVNLDFLNKLDPQILETDSKLKSGIIYKDILNNIDLKYEILSNQIKESIILKKQDNDIERLKFNISTNLELKLDDGFIVALDNEKQVFKFDIPYMIDDSQKINQNIGYSLIKHEAYYELNLKLDELYLKKASYPVIIDPTITNYTNENSVYDTYIFPNDNDVVRYNQSYLKVGVDSNNVTNRALLKFDLPTIGTGSQIISAKLELRGYPDTTSTHVPSIINIHRMTSNWNEQIANWSETNDKYDSKVEGVFYSTRDYLVQDGAIIPYMAGADITPLVKKWYSGVKNYGIMLKQNNEVYESGPVSAFCSKNNNSSGYNPKPLLTISYRNQNGLESYMDYENQSFSSGKVFENTYNGNLTAVFSVGSTIGGRKPIDLNLIYNTNDVILNNDVGCGLGYKFNFNQTIQIYDTIDGVKYLKYLDADGTTHYFLNQRIKYEDNNIITTTYENTYFDEDGLNLRIEKYENYYLLIDKNNNEMKFEITNNIGYLTEIISVDGNKNYIIYDAQKRIIKLIDGNNNEINISYSSNQISVTSPDKTINLIYNNNKLVSIESLNGQMFIVSNSLNLIDTITDIDGKYIKYEYYDEMPYRIKKVLEYGLNDTLGSWFELEYDYNSTSITDDKGIVNTIMFNDRGNPISKNCLNGRDDVTTAFGKKFVFNTSKNSLINKLCKKELSSKYVRNYLTNSSFEEDIPNTYASLGSYFEVTDECANTGKQSLKLNFISSNSIINYDSITLPKGRFYTFSAYYKTSNIPIKLCLKYQDVNDDEVFVTSDELLSMDQFERSSVTIFYPENATSDLTICFECHTQSPYYFSSYIDDVQLEDGEVANRYNLITNSGFECGLDDWLLTAHKNGNSISTNNIFSVVNVDAVTKALKVAMNPENSTSFSKNFDINGLAGDSFTISFWYKNEGLKAGETMGVGTYNNVVFAFIPYESIPTDLLLSRALNCGNDNWQYFSETFEAPWDFKSLRIYFHQDFNANDLYITNINVFKDVRSVTYEYDEFGNIIKAKNLDNNDNLFKYDKNNQLIKMIEPKGGNFVYEYDNLISDRVLRCISGTGISNEVTYDNNGNPTNIKILNRGITDDLENGSYQIRMKGTNKCLKVIHNHLSTIDANCVHDKWILEKVVQNEVDYYKIKHFILDKYISISDTNIVLRDQNISYFELINKDNGSYIIKYNNKYIRYDNEFIISDLVEDDPSFEFYFEKMDSDYFIESEATYTDDGKYVLSVNDTNFNKTTYDTDSLTGLIKSVTNAKGKKVYYNYDNKRRISSIIEGDKVVNYEYNSNNLLSKIIQGDREYSFDYDEFLNITSVKINNDIVLVTNNYENNNGKLLSSVYGNNDIIEFTYDAFSRLSEVIKMNDTFKYYYDYSGDLVKVKSNDDIVEYIYDISKKLYMYKFNDFNIKYTYDKNGNVINTNYKLGEINHSISNTLNDDDAIDICNLDNDVVNYSYDSLGRLENKNINSIIDTNYDFITNGKRTSLIVKSMDTNNDKYSYKYDKLNNITHIYHNDVLENRYWYDSYNQLVKENDYLLNRTIRYKYDTYGNLLFKKIYELDSYSLISEDKYSYNPNWQDQLIKFNNTLINYDNIGNPITIGDINLDWINGRQLNRYSDNNNDITYKYDKDNLRISKTINNIKTKYYLEGSSIVFEKTGNNVLYFKRSNGELIGFDYNNISYYYLKNNQMDIIGIIDSNGLIVAKYVYDSWGNILSIKDSNDNDISNDYSHIANINPFRYRSYYYDKETKLYYLNNRYYNPLWGRFLNIDSVINSNKDMISNNLYIYCSNNPINNVDSSGNGWIKDFVKTAGKAIINKAEKLVIGFCASQASKVLPTASILLGRSLLSNPKDVTYGNNSLMAIEMKNSKTFKSKINEIVAENPNATLNKKPIEDLQFDEWDLKLGIHKASAAVSGNLENGHGTLFVTVDDDYDFHFLNKEDKTNSVLKIINNIAWGAQEIGTINKYHITVNFEYEV